MSECARQLVAVQPGAPCRRVRSRVRKKVTCLRSATTPPVSGCVRFVHVPSVPSVFYAVCVVCVFQALQKCHTSDADAGGRVPTVRATTANKNICKMGARHCLLPHPASCQPAFSLAPAVSSDLWILILILILYPFPVLDPQSCSSLGQSRLRGRVPQSVNSGAKLAERGAQSNTSKAGFLSRGKHRLSAVSIR